MAVKSDLMKKVNRLVEEGQGEEACRILEEELHQSKNVADYAKVARELALLLRFQLKDRSPRSARFALAAAQAYLASNQPASATFIYKLMSSWKGAEAQTHALENMIVDFNSKAPSDEDSGRISRLGFKKKTAEKAAQETSEDWLHKLSGFINSSKSSLPPIPIPVISKKKSNFQVQPLFPSLSRSDVKRLLVLSQIENIKAQEILFKEGDNGDAFYIIADGKILLSSQSGMQKTLQVGDFFGEFAVFAKTPRTATARALADSTLLVFSRKQLDKAYVESRELRDRLQKVYMRRFFLSVAGKSLFFQDFSAIELEETYSFFRPLKVKANTRLIEQGEKSDRFYFILHGHCEVVKDTQIIRRCGPGQFFGEIGLLAHSPRTASVRAETDCGLLECGGERFFELLARFPRLKRVFLEVASMREPSMRKRMDPLKHILD